MYISVTDIWVNWIIEVPHFNGDNSEACATEMVALGEIMPINLMSGREVEIPPAISRVQIRSHWPLLRALIAAERIHKILERSI